MDTIAENTEVASTSTSITMAVDTTTDGAPSINIAAPVTLKPSNKRSYCGVLTCTKNSFTHPELSFFKVPANSERERVWLKNIHRERTTVNQRILVCETHFERKFINSSNVIKRLVINATPTLCLPDISVLPKRVCQKLENNYQSKSIQTEVPVVIVKHQGIETDKVQLNNVKSQTPKRLLTKAIDKKKGCSKCKRLKLNLRPDGPDGPKITKREAFLRLCDNFLSKNLSKLVKIQTNLKTASKGNRYSNEFKFFALNLYYTSPEAYRLLKSTLCLPSISTLKRLYIPLSTEINENLTKTLKMKVEHISEKEKQCVVCVGAMNIKSHLYYDIKKDKISGFHELDGIQRPEPAKHALIVMVRGIYSGWEQPIAFSFLAESKCYEFIKEWIDRIINKLFEIGLNVRGFITDVENDFVSAESRGVTSREPYFFLDSKKIHYIYDPLNLMKLVRNCWIKNDYHYHGYVAKWQHIRKTYEYDSKKLLRLAPKLTEDHIKPNRIQKLYVELVSQTLSVVTATAVSTYTELNVLDESAKGTVDFILKMNNLFSFLNSTSTKAKDFYKKAFIGDLQQKEFLYKMYAFFNDIRITNSKNGCDFTKEIKFIDGFKLTINSIISLSQDLKADYYNYLYTSNLNQNCLENFFDKIRQRAGECTEPTCKQLVAAFGKIFIFNILQSPQGDGLDILDKLLIRTEEYADLIQEAITSDDTLNTSTNDTVVSSHDYNTLEIPDHNPIIYISGYLLAKCLENHQNCDFMKEYVSWQQESAIDYGLDSKYAYRLKASQNDEDKIIIPSDNFIKFVYTMEEKFKTYFNVEFLREGILQGLLETLDNDSFMLPCPCFPLLYLKKLYFRLRIYNTIKNNNNNFKKSRKKENFVVGAIGS